MPAAAPVADERGAPVREFEHRESAHTAARRGPSLRVNVLWTFVGNVASSLSLWLLLVVLTKLASVETVGLFAVAQAIALPVNTLLGLRLQLVQVTDARDEYVFGDYLALKSILMVVSVVTAGLIGAAMYAGPTTVVVVFLATGYAVLELREMFLATMQKAERMDKVTQSNLLQSVLSLAGFAGLLALTHSLLWSITGLIGARLLVLGLHDVPVARGLRIAAGVAGGPGVGAGLRPVWDFARLRRLFWLAAPLGIVGWANTLFNSVPRLVLDKYCGTAEVGYFAAISSLILAGITVMGAVGQTISPRLSRYWVEDRDAYKRLLLKFLAVSVAVGVAGILVSVLFGRLVLRLCFDEAYAAHDGLLVNVMAAGAILYLFSCMNYALTTARQFAIQLPLYALCVVVVAAGAFWLVPRFGMHGAAWAMAGCFMTGFVGCAVVLLRELSRRNPTMAGR